MKKNHIAKAIFNKSQDVIAAATGNVIFNKDFSVTETTATVEDPLHADESVKVTIKVLKPVKKTYKKSKRHL